MCILMLYMISVIDIYNVLKRLHYALASKQQKRAEAYKMNISEANICHGINDQNPIVSCKTTTDFVQTLLKH